MVMRHQGVVYPPHMWPGRHLQGSNGAKTRRGPRGLCLPHLLLHTLLTARRMSCPLSLPMRVLHRPRHYRRLHTPPPHQWVWHLAPLRMPPPWLQQTPRQQPRAQKGVAVWAQELDGGQAKAAATKQPRVPPSLVVPAAPVLQVSSARVVAP